MYDETGKRLARTRNASGGPRRRHARLPRLRKSLFVGETAGITQTGRGSGEPLEGTFLRFFLFSGFFGDENRPRPDPWGVSFPWIRSPKP